MLIRRLKLDYFGKFSDKEIELKPGINLIYGENEAGKSTLHTFIKGMLFGIERLRGRGSASKEDTYTRYLPWDYPGAYGGQMDIRVEERDYRLQRSFHSNDKSFTILDLQTGREYKLKEGLISELIPGLTEAAFRNTISICQLRSATDAELASHVRNYITNLSMARSREVDVEKAVSLLREKKKALEAVDYNRQLSSLSNEIEKGNEKERIIDTLIAEQKAIKSKEASLREQAKTLMAFHNKEEEELINNLPAVLEKYSVYRELVRQYTQTENQLEELNVKLMEKEREVDKFKEHENRHQSLDQEVDHRVKGLRRKGLYYIACTALIALIALFLTKSLVVGGGVLWMALLVGGLLLVFSNKKHDLVRKDLQRRLAQEHKINHEENLKARMYIDHIKEQIKELSQRKSGLEDSCDELHDTIMIYMGKFISEEELTFEAVTRLKEAINIRKKESSKRISEINSQLNEYSLQIEKISWELALMENNEAELIENQEKYNHIKEKQCENEVELSAINLALNTIQELSVAIHDSFGMELNKSVADIIGKVTNYKYQELKIDEKLNIKLGWKDNYIMLDRLSSGTIDQVYFALRLAVADLLLGENSMPLLLDDSFVLYDDNRVKAVLNQIVQRKQVILFSCQQREKYLLDEIGLPFNYINLM